jgi:hypothetical protein
MTICAQTQRLSTCWGERDPDHFSTTIEINYWITTSMDFYTERSTKIYILLHTNRYFSILFGGHGIICHCRSAKSAANPDRECGSHSASVPELLPYFRLLAILILLWRANIQSMLGLCAFSSKEK